MHKLDWNQEARGALREMHSSNLEKHSCDLVAQSILQERDKAIIAALDHHLGKDWNIDEIKHRCVMVVDTYYTEYFVVDGIKLLKFEKFVVTHYRKDNSYFIKAVQPCQKLYDE